MQRLKDIRGLKFPEEYLIRFFFKHGLHNATGKVLEAGCANGCNLRLFREYGWDTVGIDISGDSICDAEANFAAMPGADSGYRSIRHDLTGGLPSDLEGPFDCLLFPSSLYYIPRASAVRVLSEARRLARPGAAIYLRMRTLGDFRFGRGEQVELHAFRLTTEITGERGALNVFYHEYELVEMLRDCLAADPAQLKVLHVDYENVQNETVVSNSDVVISGALAGLMAAIAPLLVRADCSEAMGTGHVMRCLALAQAAQEEGRRAVYAVAQCSAGVAERLRAEGIEIIDLACEPGTEQDAAATTEAARTRGADWIVLDGYHFDAAYQSAVKKSRLKLLVVDDFGALDRYSADIIVNQDPIAGEHLYRCRETRALLLLGSEYTLLRREFRHFPRPRRRIPGVARAVLLTFGGSDPGQLTEMALAELAAVPLEGLEAVVLVGPGNSRWEALQTAFRGCGNIRLRRDPPDIPHWMAWCDLAVIAAGSTIWELAYCRVPCIAVLTHKDQLPSMELLVKRGACLSLDIGSRLAAGQMTKAISDLCRDPQRREAMGESLGEMVDGLGAERVLAAMAEGAKLP